MRLLQSIRESKHRPHRGSSYSPPRLRVRPMHSRGWSSYSPPRRTCARQVDLRTADLFFLDSSPIDLTHIAEKRCFSIDVFSIVQRIMSTVEKTSTGVDHTKLLLNKSIRLSNRILSPPDSLNPLSQKELSDTMDNWVAR